MILRNSYKSVNYGEFQLLSVSDVFYFQFGSKIQYNQIPRLRGWDEQIQHGPNSARDFWNRNEG